MVLLAFRQKNSTDDLSTMNLIKSALFASMLALFAGCETPQPSATASAPIGNFDTLIVPGQRIGPVAMGKSVAEIVSQLGKPDYNQQTTRYAGEVTYTYTRYGIWFCWNDQGLQPVVETGLRGINVDSNRWATAEGIRVGNSIQDVIQAYGKPDHLFGATIDKPECTLWYNSGINFRAKNRNSPIYEISVVPAGEFGGHGETPQD